MKHSSGFTLIEMSIVLVIIGLLVGGIMGGRMQILHAELKSVAEDAAKYTEAAYKFKDKYQYFPGDMRDSQTIWGARPDCSNVVSPPPLTCNGDGNGKVEWEGVAVLPAGRGHERNLFWQHLAQAGLITGSYTGQGTYPAEAWSGEAFIGVTLPASRVEGVGFGADTYNQADTDADSTDDDGNSFWGKADIRIQASKKRTDLAGMYIDWPAFTILEAQGMDQKFDDGKPNLGKIYAQQRYAFNPESYYCTTDTPPFAYESGSGETVRCHLFFLDLGR